MSSSIASRVSDETKEHIQRSLRKNETASQFLSSAIENELIRRRISVPERDVTLKDIDVKIKLLSEIQLEQSLKSDLIISKIKLLIENYNNH